MTLPLCTHTEIPRILCDHCESFTMTDEERGYIRGWVAYAPATSTPGTPKEITEYRGGGWSQPRDVKVVDSSTICRTPGCTRPSGDAFVCAPCVDDLEMCLADMPKLEEDLVVLAMRQARFTGASVGGDRSPLPVNLNASDRLACMNSTLVSAVKQITEQRGLPKPQLRGATAVSRWLLAHVHSVAMDEGGGDVVADVKREHSRAMWTIDCPPDRVYIGLCGQCATPMHAKAGEIHHKCRTCSNVTAIAGRLQDIDEKIQDMLLSLREIADLSERHLGGKVTLKQLEGLVRRRRLAAVSHRPSTGRHEQIALYRAADVVAIMDERKAS